jgi:CRISPR-associated endonuclease/helicase Cas3
MCGKSSKLENGKRAWVWDWLGGEWRVAQGRDFYPGQTLLVASDCGGYDFDVATRRGKGWSPDSKKPVLPVPSLPVAADEFADSGQDDESLSLSAWKTIATHGREVGALASSLAEKLVPQLAGVFDLAGRCHDIGKSHAAFQGMIVADDRPERRDLAKAPQSAWSRTGGRKGFRHELASVLALFSVLQRHNPDHPAMLGPWREFLTAAGMPPAPAEEAETLPTPLEMEILALNADQLNLLAYLVCTHHGKVRLAWHACPDDQAATDDTLRIRGIRDNDSLPQLQIYADGTQISSLPASILDLAPSVAGLNPRTGQGWTERVLYLLDRHGPYTLAWYEAILRAADQRASGAATRDELLSREVAS